MIANIGSPNLKSRKSTSVSRISLLLPNNWDWIFQFLSCSFVSSYSAACSSIGRFSTVHSMPNQKGLNSFKTLTLPTHWCSIRKITSEGKGIQNLCLIGEIYWRECLKKAANNNDTSLINYIKAGDLHLSTITGNSHRKTPVSSCLWFSPFSVESNAIHFQLMRQLSL